MQKTMQKHVRGTPGACVPGFPWGQTLEGLVGPVPVEPRWVLKLSKQRQRKTLSGGLLGPVSQDLPLRKIPRENKSKHMSQGPDTEGIYSSRAPTKKEPAQIWPRTEVTMQQSPKHKKSTGRGPRLQRNLYKQDPEHK